MQWKAVCIYAFPDESSLYLFGEKLHAQGASTENVTKVRGKKKGISSLEHN